MRVLLSSFTLAAMVAAISAAPAVFESEQLPPVPIPGSVLNTLAVPLEVNTAIPTATHTTTAYASVPTEAVESDENSDGSIETNAAFLGKSLKVAAGVTNGSPLDPAIVPRGNYFTGFDIRADDQGDLGGFQSLSAFTQPSVDVAVGPSSAAFMPQKKAGTISSDQEFSTAYDLSISFNGAFLGGVASVEAAFGYSTKSSSSSHLVSGYTYGEVQLPGNMLANLKKLSLTEDALELLTSDLNDFFDAYGTHYIRTRVYGCDAAASYTFSCSTQSAAQDIKASLQANYNTGAVSVGGSVSTAYSTYSASSICTYSGTTQASGLDTTSPSSSQMMNATLMDEYWNSFESNCRANAQTASKLLYVELGNWWDVPAVRHALANNQTASNLLKFMSTLGGDDLVGLSYASVYLSKVRAAVSNMSQALLSSSTPPAFSTGFFDRITGQGMPSLTSYDYWQQLPSGHANIVSRLPQAAFNNFFNMQTIQTAINNGPNYDASFLIRNYFNNAQKLYMDAANVYKYAYSSVTLTVLSFEADNITPSSHKVVVNAGAPCSQTESQSGLPGFCAVDEAYHYGNVPLQFGIRSTPSTSNMPMIEAYARDNVHQWSIYNDNNSGAVNYVDMTPTVRQVCPGCTKPVRMDLSIQYVMSDITMNSSPYL